MLFNFVFVAAVLSTSILHNGLCQNSYELGWKAVYTTSLEMTWLQRSGELYALISSKNDRPHEADCPVSILETETSPSNVTGLWADTGYHIGLCVYTSQGFSTLISIGPLYTSVPPPDITTITCTSFGELHVTWNPHCSSNCPPNRFPAAYIVKYAPVEGGVVLHDSVESSNPGQVYPDTWITLTEGVEPNTKYLVSVMEKIHFLQVNDERAIATDFSDVHTGITIPGKSQAVSVSHISSTTVLLQWDRVTGPLPVTYELSWSSPTDSHSISGLSDNHLQNEFLKSNTEYVFTQRARNVVGYGEQSKETVSATFFAKPTSLYLKSRTDTSAELEWSDPIIGGGALAVAGYFATWYSGVDSISKNLTVYTTSIKLSALTPNTKYYFKVAAFSSENVGDFCEYFEIITLLDQPQSLILEDAKVASLVVSWSPPAAGGNVLPVAEYAVTWSSETSNGSDGKKTENGTSAIIGNLTPNTKYTISVAARGEIGGDVGKRSYISANTRNGILELLRGFADLDDGWIAPFNGHQYKLTPFARNWNESRAVCQNWGGDLIAYGAQDYKVREIIMRSLQLNSRYWVGLFDRADGTFVWVNGHVQSSIDASLWLPGYPSESGKGESCGLMYLDEDHALCFKLYEMNCWNQNRQGICEKLVV